MKKFLHTLKRLYEHLVAFFRNKKNPQLTEDIAWSLAGYNLYATLDAQELDCFLLSLEKSDSGNFYHAVFGQLTYPDKVEAKWFTGEAEAEGIMEYLDHRIFFDENEGEFCIDDCEIHDPDEVKIKDFEKSEAYMKTLFCDCDFAGYMEEEGIEQNGLIMRLQEPYQTWFKTIHHEYQAPDT